MKISKLKKLGSPFEIKKNQSFFENTSHRVEERIPECQGDLADRATSEIDNEIARLVNRVCQASRRDSRMRQQAQF